MGSTPALKLVRAIDSGGMRTAHVCVDGWILGGFVPVNSLPESPMHLDPQRQRDVLRAQLHHQRLEILIAEPY